MATAECLYWYKQALEHIEIDQFSKAAAAIDCAINADPSCAEAWDIKSLVHCCQQDFDKAIVALNHALELAPNAAVHWRNKAIILQSLDSGGIENWTIREEAQIAEMWATELEEHPETVKLPVQAHIIVHALAIFLSATISETDSNETYKALSQQRQHLFTDFAARTLEFLVRYAEQNEEAKEDGRLWWLGSHQIVLSDSRIYGIDRACQAFEAYNRLTEEGVPLRLLSPPLLREIGTEVSLLVSELASDADMGIKELDGIAMSPFLEAHIQPIRRRLSHNIGPVGTSVIPELITQLEEVLAYAEQEKPYNPLVLAALMKCLSIAYLKNPQGNEEDNIEDALKYGQRALVLLSHKTVTEEYQERGAFIFSYVLDTVAKAYLRRLRGDQAENKECAIAIYENLLSSLRPNAFGVEWAETKAMGWAKTKVSLAQAYCYRLKDPPAVNIELALVCLQEALTVLTYEKYPGNWGILQLHIGNLYMKRVYDERADNIEQAITSYENAMMALEYYPSLPFYMEIERNLSLAYTMREKGNRAANLELARLCLDAPFQFYRDDYPTETRNLQLDRAVLEADCGQWEDAHKAYQTAHEMESIVLEQAAGAAQQDRVLKQGRDAATRHGYVLTRLGKVRDAAVEIERGRARGLAEAQILRQADINRIGDVDRRACFQEAYVRLLKAQATLYTPLSPPKSLFGKPIETENWEREKFRQRTTAFRRAKARFDEIVDEIRNANDPANFLADTLDATTIQNAAKRGGPGHALVYVVATPWGGIALSVVGTTAQPNQNDSFQVLDLPGLTDDFVRTLIKVKIDDKTDRIVGGFAHAQRGDGYSVLLHRWKWPGESFRTRAEALHNACLAYHQNSTLDEAAQKVLANPTLASLADNAWITTHEAKPLVKELSNYFFQAEIERCLQALAPVVAMPLIGWLRKQCVTSYTLIPCGALAAFPLGAVAISDTSTLAEAMPMSIAPNARSLFHDEQSTPVRSGVYALTLSDKEAEIIVALGGDKKKAYTGNNATLDKFIEAAQHGLVFHIGCHGKFDTRDFLRSAILLAGEQEVTLGNLLSQRVGQHDLVLRGLHLLVLAACETAVLDLEGAQDEVRSLATGMMEAGVRAVLGTLWRVRRKATYLLMFRFAQEWFPRMDNEPPAAALARAQHWLRTLTKHELQQWEAGKGKLMDEKQPIAEAELSVIPIVEEEFEKEQGPDGNGFPDGVVKQHNADFNTYPYAHPLYWAGFQIMGW